jgi:hypothetical protein
MARKKKRRKIPLRTQLRRLANKADVALSLYVREMTKRMYDGKCPFCGVNPIQCNFHFIRRKRKILRWDIRNVIGACHSDNYKEYRDPDVYRAWFIRRFGVDLYLELADKSKESFDPSVEFLQGIIDEYTKLLEVLNGKDSSVERNEEDTTNPK